MKLNQAAFRKEDEDILINKDAIIDDIGITLLAYAKNALIIPVKWKHVDKSTRILFRCDLLVDKDNRGIITKLP